MNVLENWVFQIIREKGPLSFRDFMYWALYHPEWGYYTRDISPFGKQGDFYTSPGVHSVFGETIAKDLLIKWADLGKPTPFILVEYGAGEGRLARDILNALEQTAPGLQVSYNIIEVSQRLRKLQQQTLGDNPVTWLDDISQLGKFTGIVISNELIDAFPVHVLRKNEHSLEELYIGVSAEQFIETYEPVAEQRLLSYVEQYLPFIEPGMKLEANIDALDWLEQISRFLQEGFVLTIDYGEEAKTLYQGRPNGSLRGFQAHQVTDNPYNSLGSQDITADVNFTALMNYGAQIGLKTVFYGTQANYLIEAGIMNSLSAQASRDPFQADMKKNLAIKQLLMPGSMGDRFKVLIQKKQGSA